MRRLAQFALVSDPGRVREHNEDTCAADRHGGRYVVCDGMGGANAGEVASQAAAQIFLDYAAEFEDRQPPQQRLQQAVVEANRHIHNESLEDATLHGMGTTLVALELDEPGRKVWTVNVGDSRCYRLRDGRLQQMTHDHSFVDEQVRLGLLSSDAAALSPMRNVITRAVGSHPDVDPDVEQHPMQAGDIYLLCSDGLSNELDDDEIRGVMEKHTQDMDACAQALVNLANEFGGMDNISVVLVRV